MNGETKSSEYELDEKSRKVFKKLGVEGTKEIFKELIDAPSYGEKETEEIKKTKEEYKTMIEDDKKFYQKGGEPSGPPGEGDVGETSEEEPGGETGEKQKEGKGETGYKIGQRLKVFLEKGRSGNWITRGQDGKIILLDYPPGFTPEEGKEYTIELTAVDLKAKREGNFFHRAEVVLPKKERTQIEKAKVEKKPPPEERKLEFADLVLELTPTEKEGILAEAIRNYVDYYEDRLTLEQKRDFKLFKDFIEEGNVEHKGFKFSGKEVVALFRESLGEIYNKRVVPYIERAIREEGGERKRERGRERKEAKGEERVSERREGRESRKPEEDPEIEEKCNKFRRMFREKARKKGISEEDINREATARIKKIKTALYDKKRREGKSVE